jgi:hypothetical protein
MCYTFRGCSAGHPPGRAARQAACSRSSGERIASVTIQDSTPLEAQAPEHSVRAFPRARLAHLLLAGALLEAWLLALFSVAPLRVLEFTPSPLAARWPVLLAPARWVFPASWLQGPFDPAVGWPQLVLLALIFYGAAATAGAAVFLARRLGPPTRAHLLLVLAGAGVFGVTLLLIPAFPSQDIFSYIIYGRISALYHANPLTAIPSQFPQDPLLPYVFWQNTRSVYGPVWLGLSDGLIRLAEGLGGSLAVSILLFKGVAFLAHLGNALLVWAILGRLAPRQQLTGALLYAWNPLALLEFAGSGHNDALMLGLFLLGVLLLVQGHEVLALLGFAASIDTKYVFLLLLPLYFWYVLRAQSGWRARARAALWRLGVLCGAGALLYLPYWAGPRTFGSILYSPPTQELENSLVEAISWPVRWALAWLFGLSAADSGTLASIILKALMALLFGVCWLRLFPRVRSRRSLLEAWWWAIWLYLVIASGWFLPWYVTWLLVLAALRPMGKRLIATELLAGGVLVIYAMDPLTASPIYGLRSVLAFGPALAALLWRRGRRPLSSLPWHRA